MALGLALLFGIVLPQNFDAPYRAASLQEFWRRWHMTLSRFLRDYLYIPLGGNRYGLAAAGSRPCSRPCCWAGSGTAPGWTFVAWGGLHGLGPRRRRAVAARRPQPADVLALPLDLPLRDPLPGCCSGRRRFDAARQRLQGHARLGGRRQSAPIQARAPSRSPRRWRSSGRPPAHRVHMLAARAGWRSVAAFVIVLFLIRLNHARNYEFIYFQF